MAEGQQQQKPLSLAQVVQAKAQQMQAELAKGALTDMLSASGITIAQVRDLLSDPMVKPFESEQLASFLVVPKRSKIKTEGTTRPRLSPEQEAVLKERILAIWPDANEWRGMADIKKNATQLGATESRLASIVAEMVDGGQLEKQGDKRNTQYRPKKKKH
jgi:hypothetical protein